MQLFFNIIAVSPLLLKCTIQGNYPKRVVTVQNVFLYHHGFAGSCDFFGLNYCTSQSVTHKEDTSLQPQHLADMELCDAEDHVEPQWEV